jgi:two-component system chemotaxis response regulator CheY
VDSSREHKWSVLLVDDSSTVRSQLRATLEEKGVAVTEAENGSEGLWRAREHDFDLIVVDVHMPIMDGITMIAEVRKLSAHRATPIFVLTTDASSLRAQQGKQAGATAWTLKPVKPELLWKGIEHALSRKGMSVAPGENETER